MQNVTVFVFLLESIPGFENTLKTKLENISEKYTDNINVTKCEPHFVDLIWKNVNKNRFTTQADHSPMLSHSKVLDDYSYFFFEKVQNSVEMPNEVIDDEKNNQYNYIKKKNKVSKKSEATTAPFLVAIFETIQNITAQTCGGTLLSSHWVLTAVSCLDLLPSFYKNISKQNILHKSHYTIIANSDNPLVDGTIHNVTEIISQPKYNLYIKKKISSNVELIPFWMSFKKNQKTASQIALMKIEQGAKFNTLSIFKGKLERDISVIVYGWTLEKSSAGQYMSVASISAEVVDTNECEVNYNIVDRSSLICLSAYNKNDIKISKISSGGPVLAYFKGIPKILAVAQIHTNSRIIAYTLSNYDWIHNL